MASPTFPLQNTPPSISTTFSTPSNLSSIFGQVRGYFLGQKLVEHHQFNFGIQNDPVFLAISKPIWVENWLEMVIPPKNSPNSNQPHFPSNFPTFSENF